MPPDMATNTQDTAGVLRWEDPPAHGNSKSRGGWKETADSLRSHPGEWALIAENASVGTYSNIKNGALADFRPVGAFEARTVKNGNPGRCRLYARYIGEVSE